MISSGTRLPAANLGRAHPQVTQGRGSVKRERHVIVCLQALEERRPGLIEDIEQGHYFS
jgi:hypothetical protein